MKIHTIFLFFLATTLSFGQMTYEERIQLSEQYAAQKSAQMDTTEFTVLSRSCGGDLAGPFLPGETVVINIQYFYNNPSATWLHGFVPSFGSGWELPDFSDPTIAPTGNGNNAEWFAEDGDCAAFLQADVTEVCTYMDDSGMLQICNLLNEECPCSGGMLAGDLLPSGYYWNQTGASPSCGSECTPNDNYGIGASSLVIDWTLMLNVKDFDTFKECENDTDLQIGIQVFSDGITGCWVDPANKELISPKGLSPEWEVDCNNVDLECGANKIHFDVFIDYNQNGTQDSNEPNFYNSAIKVLETDQVFQDYPFGFQNFYLPNGIFNIMIDSTSIVGWENTSPATVVVDLNMANTSDTIFFGIYPTETIRELDVEVSYSSKRCSDFTEITLGVYNEGYFPESGWLWFQPDSNIIDLDFHVQPDSMLEGNIFGWHYTALPPGNVFNVNIGGFILGPPTIPVGTLISSCVWVEYKDEMGNVEIAVAKKSEFYLLCSYDPNDKAVEPNHPLNYTNAEIERLIYVVRFQNTGNASAIDVEIVDTLSEFVIPSSLRILKTSHDSTLIVRRNGGTVLVFEFNNIMLPDSTSSPLLSQGYLVFSVELRNNLPEGTKINNAADIYFDNNPAITTNTVTNILFFDKDQDGFFSFEDCDDLNASINPDAEEIPNNDIDEDCNGEDLISSVANEILDKIIVSPNPNLGLLNISNPSSHPISVTVLDINGRAIKNFEPIKSALHVDISDCESGLYFLSVKDADGNIRVIKLVKM